MIQQIRQQHPEENEEQHARRLKYREKHLNKRQWNVKKYLPWLGWVLFVFLAGATAKCQTSNVDITRQAGTLVDATGLPVKCLSGCSSAGDTTASGVLGSLNATLQIAMAGVNSASVTLPSGNNLIGTLLAESSSDGGTTWAATVIRSSASTGLWASSQAVSSTNASYNIQVPGGASHVRVRVNPWTSGTATASIRATTQPDSQPDPLVQGTQAAASVTQPNPLVHGGWDGSNVRSIKTLSDGTQVMSTAITGTVTLGNLPTQPFLNATDFNDVTASTPVSGDCISAQGSPVKWIRSVNCVYLNTANAFTSAGTMTIGKWNAIEIVDGVRNTTLLSAVNNLPSTGGLVIIPPNYTETLTCGSTVIAPGAAKPITFWGSGETSIIQGTGCTLFLITASYTAFENFRIQDSNTSTGNASTIAINIDNGTTATQGWVLDHMHLVGGGAGGAAALGTGLRVNFALKGAVTDSIIDFWGIGYDLEGADATHRSNANSFKGGEIRGGLTGIFGGANGFDDAYFTSMSIEGAVTGVNTQTGKASFINCHFENNQGVNATNITTTATIISIANFYGGAATNKDIVVTSGANPVFSYNDQLNEGITNNGTGTVSVTDNAITFTTAGTGIIIQRTPTTFAQLQPAGNNEFAITGFAWLRLGVGNKLTEIGAPSGTAGFSWLWADSTAHTLKANMNNNGAVTLASLETSQNWTQPHNNVGETAIVADSGAINTTETIIVKTPAFAASRLIAGSHIRITLTGTCTSTVANVSTFTLRWGTNGTTADGTVAALASSVAAASGTNNGFRAVIDLTVRVAGASATSSAFMELLSDGNIGIVATPNEKFVAGTAFNTTTANAILSLAYKSAATTTTSTFKNAVIEIVYQ